MDDSNIIPGSPVRTADGVAGVVDSIVTDESGIELTGIVVHADGMGARYSVPANLISGVRTENGQDVVYLSGNMQALEQHRIGSAHYADIPGETTQYTNVVSTDHHAGGLMERLQTGLDALAHGGRDARGDRDEETEVLRVPVIEEQLVSNTEQVRIGTLHVHKSVETTQETIPVSVSHEEPEVTYIGVDEYDQKAPYQPGETFIPIMGEKIVVEKRTVIIGYVRVRKHSVTEEQLVTDTVRRERVTVDQDTTPPPSS